MSLARDLLRLGAKLQRLERELVQERAERQRAETVIRELQSSNRQLRLALAAEGARKPAAMRGAERAMAVPAAMVAVKPAPG